MRTRMRTKEIIKAVFAALAVLIFLALCLAVPSIASETGTSVDAIRAELGAVSAGTPVADIRAELGVVPPGTTVVVLQGDTYSGIAAAFCEKGVRSLAALVEANGISLVEANTIFPGDSIFIPSGLLRPTFRDPLRKVAFLNKKLGVLATENAGLVSNLVDAKGEIINLGNSLHERVSKEITAAIAAAFVIILLGLTTFILRRQNNELVKDERELKIALNEKESEKTRERNEEIVAISLEKRKLKLALDKERKLTEPLMEALAREV